MKLKTFLTLSSLIFVLIGTLHLLRLFFGWPMVFCQWQVPVWASGPGAFIGYALGILGLKLRDKSR